MSENVAGPEPVLPAEALPPAGSTRRKRRWWVYVLWGVGGLAVLAVVVLVLVVGYWHSLVRNYTATRPVPVPVVENVEQVQQDLMGRWTSFADAVFNKRPVQPFRLTSADLNALVMRNPQLKGRLHLQITNNQVTGHFSVPLDNARQKELKGRFLNGELTLMVLFEDGLLTVSVDEVKANGHTPPGWIVSRVRSQNFGQMLDRNREAMAFLQRIDTIQVDGDQVVITPLQAP